MEERLVLALEGGGTRSQAVLMDGHGRVLQIHNSADVNTNFTSVELAQSSVLEAVKGALSTAKVAGEAVTDFACALVATSFGPETWGSLCPRARYSNYDESAVVFARAGIFHPHGVAAVAATGASAWGVRADDGRKLSVGGWGALLGDEGSAYAMGLLGMRAAARAYEGRLGCPTRLVEAFGEYLGLSYENFHSGLVRLAYNKPLSRTEIAGLAVIVTGLAAKEDPAALQIVAKVASDLAALPLHVARQLFTPSETFKVVLAGGLINAGERIVGPLRTRLAAEFPLAELVIGTEQPAVALARLVLEDLRSHTEEAC